MHYSISVNEMKTALPGLSEKDLKSLSACRKQIHNAKWDVEEHTMTIKIGDKNLI